MFHFNHFSQILVNAYEVKARLAPLQRVLHAAARVVMDLRPRDHVSPALRDLHWLPIKQRIEFKLCLLVHKSLIGHSPAYISDLLTSAADVPGRHDPPSERRAVAIS